MKDIRAIQCSDPQELNRRLWEYAAALLDFYDGAVGDHINAQLEKLGAQGDHEGQRLWFGIADRIMELVNPPCRKKTVQ